MDGRVDGYNKSVAIKKRLQKKVSQALQMRHRKWNRMRWDWKSRRIENLWPCMVSRRRCHHRRHHHDHHHWRRYSFLRLWKYKKKKISQKIKVLDDFLFIHYNSHLKDLWVRREGDIILQHKNNNRMRWLMSVVMGFYLLKWNEKLKRQKGKYKIKIAAE